VTDQHHSGRGGLRNPKGGRPKGTRNTTHTDRTERLQLRVTPTEHAKVRELLKKMREGEKND
jgi:hypothetical protein